MPYDFFYHDPDASDLDFKLTLRVMDVAEPECFNALIDPFEDITKKEAIEIVFDYPLSKPCTLTFSRPAGFTRRSFAQAVYDGYMKIYDEEESAAGKTDNIPGMLNRSRSDGPHGIWGHVIGDLFLEGAEEVSPGKFELIMGS